MRKNEEIADGLRKDAELLESLPDFDCSYILGYNITPKTEEEVAQLAKAKELHFHQEKFRDTMCTSAITDETTSVVRLYFSTIRELEPEEYPQSYKDRKALAAKQYLSDREQALIDFIHIMAFNGLNRIQAEHIYEAITAEFKLVPLTEEEKKISRESAEAETQK